MEIVTAVKNYSSLLNIEYELVIGRKGKSKILKIIFDKSSWFHVGGIHYLSDIEVNQNRQSAERIFDEIISGKISEDYFKKSINYDSILDRIELLSRLSEIIEKLDNNIASIYAFSKKYTSFYTTIDGDYLIVDLSSTEDPINLFLVFEKVDDITLKPMSVFYPIIDTKTGLKLDYSKGQMKYTLLLSKKRNITTGESIEIFRNSNYKE